MLLFLVDEEAPVAGCSATATAPPLLLLVVDKDGLLVRRDERRRDPVSFDVLLLTDWVSILLAWDAACDEVAAVSDNSARPELSLIFLLPDLPMDTRLYLVGGCELLAALAGSSGLRLLSSLLFARFRPLEAPRALLLRLPVLLLVLLEDADDWMSSEAGRFSAVQKFGEDRKQRKRISNRRLRKQRKPMRNGDRECAVEESK